MRRVLVGPYSETVGTDRAAARWRAVSTATAPAAPSNMPASSRSVRLGITSALSQSRNAPGPLVFLFVAPGQPHR